MYNVKFVRGYFEVSGDFSEVPQESFSWLTHDKKKGVYYFLPNYTTRKNFIEQMLKDPNCNISREDKEFLRYFTLSQRIDRSAENLVFPDLGGGKQMKWYQVYAVEQMMKHRNYCLFLGPGTGKTLIAIAYLNNAQPKTVLIITPKKVIKQYTEELLKHCTYMPAVEIINPEQLRSQEYKYSNAHYECVIVDESHRFKEYTSIQSQILREMKKDYCYLFTGTPQDKSRYEVFAQISLFDKRFMPTKTKWMDRYFQLNEYYQPEIEKLPGELTQMLQMVSFGAQTDDLIDLPPAKHYVIKCKRPEIYDELKENHFINDIDFKLICDKPGKYSIKLRQAVNGHLTDDFKRVKRFHTDKETKLVELLATLSNGVVYTQFDLDIEVVERALKVAGKSFRTVYGKVSPKQADLNIEFFKKAKVEFLVIQAASGNAGLDLFVTNNIIFYGLPTSYIIYEQCIRRTRRLGQKADECNYYYLLCSGSIDMHIRQLNQQKKSFNANLYSAYKMDNIKLQKVLEQGGKYNDN